jgi:hypothetical protein
MAIPHLTAPFPKLRATVPLPAVRTGASGAAGRGRRAAARRDARE